MAFKSGPASGALVPGSRTYSQAVDRIMRACGITPAGAVTANAGERAGQAKIAVIDAAERIYHASLWQFRYRHRLFEPEDGKAWYDMPEDWAARGTFAIQMEDTSVSHRPPANVEYVDYHKLLSCYPMLRSVMPDIVSDGGLAESGRQIDLHSNQDFAGVPRWFTIIGNKLMLFPVPSQTVIDSQGLEYVLGVDWLFGYYGTMPELEDSDDAIPLPPNMWPIHHHLSLAYFKQALEYGDFTADEARGERMLMSAMAQALQYQGPTGLGDFSNGLEV